MLSALGFGAARQFMIVPAGRLRCVLVDGAAWFKIYVFARAMRAVMVLRVSVARRVWTFLWSCDWSC